MLGNWVNTQRQKYKLLKEGKSSTMSDDRIHKLESIGFQWISEVALPTEEKNDLWHERFQELKKYEKTHDAYPPYNHQLGRKLDC